MWQSRESCPFELLWSCEVRGGYTSLSTLDKRLQEPKNSAFALNILSSFTKLTLQYVFFNIRIKRSHRNGGTPQSRLFIAHSVIASR